MIRSVWSSYNRRSHLWNAAFLLALWLCLLLSTWRTWGDVYVDFPEELYVPWQLSLGKLLYQDIHHFYGPLSQYYHALLFMAFGASYTVIIVSNALVVAVMLLLVYGIFHELAGRLTAGMVAVVFLCVYPVQTLGLVGGYNLMSPYAHEATHGMLFFLASYYAWIRWQKQAWSMKPFAILAGTSLLFKPEFLLATLFLTGISLLSPVASPSRCRLALQLGLWASVPSVIMFFLFWTRQSAAESLHNTLGALSPLLVADLAANPLYEHLLGTAALGDSLGLMAYAVLAWIYIASVLFLLDRATAARARPDLRAVGMAAAIGIAFVTTIVFPWPLLMRGLAVVNALLVLGLVLAAWNSDNAMLRRRRLLWAAFGVISLVFLGKIFFKVSFDWLGFYLSIPGMMFFAGAHVGLLPNEMRARWEGGQVFRVGFVTVLLALIIQHGFRSEAVRQFKHVPIGSGGDRMYTFERATFSVPAADLRHVLERVKNVVPSDATLMVVPEAIIINYLTRHENPTPYLSTMLVKTLFDYAGGAQPIIRKLAETKPNYIIYLRRRQEMEVAEYEIRGPEGFAEPVFEWIESEYEIVERVGEDIRDFDRLTYVLLRRRSGRALDSEVRNRSDTP